MAEVIACVGAIATAITLLAIVRANDGYEDGGGYRTGARPVLTKFDFPPGRRAPPAKRLAARMIIRHLGL